MHLKQTNFKLYRPNKIYRSAHRGVDLNDVFDAVITNFVPDVFQEEKLKTIMENIYSKLKEERIWVFTDFKINQNIFHKCGRIF